MAVTKLNKSFESFSRGDVVVDSVGVQPYGVKVLRGLSVEGVGEAFIVQYGRVKNNEWFGDKRYNGEVDITIISAKKLREGYAGKWKKDTLDVKSGDVLKDQNDNVYLVSTPDTVWSVENGTHASLSYWESDGKVFTDHKIRHAGVSFSKYLDIKTTFNRI